MKTQLEFKDALAGKVKDIDEAGRRIVLYAASFDNIDYNQDVVAPGAFKKTLEEPKSIKHLMYHDDEKPVGIPEEIREDSYGLYVVSKISDTQMGRDLLTLTRDGVLDQNSIGYWPVKWSIDENTGVRSLLEVRLKEYSSVTWACNPAAVTLGVKALFDQRNLLQKSLRTGHLADETYLALESKALQIETAISELIDKPLAHEEPEAEKPTTLAPVTEPEVEVKRLNADAWAAFINAYKG